MGALAGGAMNANSGNYDYYCGFGKVSFDGFINENYFSLDSQEKNLLENLEIYHGISKNPFNYKKNIFLGLFIKSKYDGIGNRKPIDLSIALDISGSMNEIDKNSEGNSRIQLAKESLKKLVSIKDDKNDKISLVTFNHEVNKIFGLLEKNEIQNKYLNDIDNIKASGGTDLYSAIEFAMKNFDENKNNNKEKRVVVITDDVYNDKDDKLFNLIKEYVENNNISLTIMAISSSANLTLADKICHLKGCNYFTITNCSELETYLVKNFNYIFFPISYNNKIIVKSKNTKILKCIGGGNDLFDEIEEKNENKKIPSNEFYYDIGTCFSSDLIKIKEKLYMNGGLILLQIDTDYPKNENLNFDITLEYESINNIKSTQNYFYEIPNNEQENQFFKNINIRKGIAIYYFSSILNYIVEKLNKNYYIENGDVIEKNNDQKEKDVKLIESKDVIKEYLEKYFIKDCDNEITKKNYENYLKLLEERYNNYKKIIFKFYCIPDNAAPPVIMDNN